MKFMHRNAFPFFKQHGIFFCCHDRVSKALQTVRPKSASIQNACHLPDLSVSVFQFLLQIQEAAAFRNRRHSMTDRLKNCMTHPTVFRKLPGVQLRVSAAQIQSADAFRQLFIFHRRKFHKLQSLLPQRSFVFFIIKTKRCVLCNADSKPPGGGNGKLHCSAAILARRLCNVRRPARCSAVCRCTSFFCALCRHCIVLLLCVFAHAVRCRCDPQHLLQINML